MEYFSLHNDNFEEILIANKEYRVAIDNKEPISKKKFGGIDIGKFAVSMQPVGDIFISHSSMNFSKNIVTKANDAIDNITLYFERKSNKIDFERSEKTPNNSANVVFMHSDFKDKSYFLKNCEQESVSLHLPITYFKEIAERYPERFASYFLRYENGESFYLYDGYTTVSPQMHQALSQLENRQLMGSANTLYTDVKILELLDLLFPMVSDIVDYSKKYCKTQSDIEKIKEAAFILLSDIHNPPSIIELSLKAGINENKLKYGFKEVFGTTPYGYLFEHKMSLAQKYLLDTDKSISEIAMLCGYTYPTHFCTAFRRRFGVAPSDSRK